MEENSNVEKCSYEELEQKFNDLLARYQNLYVAFQKLNYENAFKRLDYLFKVLKHYSLLDTDFVRNCALEIQDLMTLKENTEEVVEVAND